jgi:3'-phosphoadenosine 5'-phosphosulfate (PAPS) 3'-phosphatase
MANAAQRASKRLLRDFNEVEQLQVSVKGPSDFVSQADLRAENTLREELNKARPGYAFLMEESGAAGSENWAWRSMGRRTSFTAFPIGQSALGSSVACRTAARRRRLA